MFRRAIRNFLIGLFTVFLHAAPGSSAGIPVIDSSNLAQNAVSAMESVSQTLKQIEEYALQLQQYEDQIRNSVAPAAYVWSQAQKTMNKVLALQDQLNSYMSMAGSLDTHLAKFGNIATYHNAPYFKTGSDEDAKQLTESEVVGSEAQKLANDNMVRTLEQQQQALKDDAATLEQLQSSAGGVQGRLEAIQFTNQLAAHQASQMLQLRVLLIAQYQASAARAQTVSAREAREQAADAKALESRFKKSSEVNWLKAYR